MSDQRNEITLDLGKINYALGADTDTQRVTVSFGQDPVSITMTGDEALQLARLLREKAMQLKE